MAEAALRFKNVGFHYKPSAWVLRGLSGEIERGETFAILGPNGRGKTTLLRLLLGALTPQEGRVVTYGRTALVPQLFTVAFDYSVLDMVLMGQARRLSWLGQPGREDERVALEVLARAVVAQADILVLDEPLSALDLRSQELVLGWIARLSRQDGLTVVFTTHQPAHALAVADRALLMLDGDAAVGPVDQVLTEERLAALYGVRLRQVALEHDGRTRTASCRSSTL